MFFMALRVNGGQPIGPARASQQKSDSSIKIKVASLAALNKKK